MQTKKLMSSLLNGKKSLWLPLLSGSMAPALLPGDELFIEPVKDKVKVGHIVVIFSEGKFYSHRVLFSFQLKNKGFILEKGDANSRASWVSHTRVIGRVTRYRRDSVIGELVGSKAEHTARILAGKSYLAMIGLPLKKIIRRALQR